MSNNKGIWALMGSKTRLGFKHKDIAVLVITIIIIGTIFSPLPGIDAVDVTLSNVNTDTSGDTEIDLKLLVRETADVTLPTDPDNTETIPSSSIIKVTLDPDTDFETVALFNTEGERLSNTLLQEDETADTDNITGLILNNIRQSGTLGPYGNFNYGTFYGYGYGIFYGLVGYGFGYGTLGNGTYGYGLTANEFVADTIADYTIDINSAVLSNGDHQIQVDVLENFDSKEFFSSGPIDFTNVNDPAATEVTVPDTTEDINFDDLGDNVKTVVVESTENLETITAESGDSIQFTGDALITDPLAETASTTAFTNEVTVFTTGSQVSSMVIPEGSVLTAGTDSGGTIWDGEITLPTVASTGFATTGISGAEFSFLVGDPDRTITSTIPIGFTLTDQAGNDIFIKRIGEDAIEITNSCGSTDPTAASTIAAASTSPQFGCIQNDGNNKFVGLTKFSHLSGKPPTPPTPSPIFGGPGGGGGGGGGAAAPGAPGIISKITILEIQYDVCEANMAWITIGVDGDTLPDVKLRTSFTGVVKATLADEQPYEEYNALNPGFDKYVFEAPLESGERFFVVIAEDISLRSMQAVTKSVQLVGCEGIIVVTLEELPPTEELPPPVGMPGIIIPELFTILTPSVVNLFIADLTDVSNQNIDAALTNYQTLQTGPDKYAELVLGIPGQSVTTIAYQDRFGRAESNNNANVFLQISHTGDSVNSMRGVQLGGDSIAVVVGDGRTVTLPISAEIAIPTNEPVDVPTKMSEKLHPQAKLTSTPPVVLDFLNNNIEIINEFTEDGLTHYVMLQTVPDVFAEQELGIQGQFVTTLAFQDRFGRADSNDNMNVFFQISHTDDKVNSLRAIQLGGDDISVIVNGIDQGIITKTTEIPMK